MLGFLSDLIHFSQVLISPGTDLGITSSTLCESLQDPGCCAILVGDEHHLWIAKAEPILLVGLKFPALICGAISTRPRHSSEVIGEDILGEPFPVYRQTCRNH